MTSSNHDPQAQALIGHRLAEVIYYEIDYRDDNGEPIPEPQWNWDPRFDSLDFGLELVMESGDAFWIGWGSSIRQFHIEIERNTAGKLDHMRKWIVSERSRWRDLIGKRIEMARMYWTWVDETDVGTGETRRIHFPQDLGLLFETGRVVSISACEIRPDGSHFGSADNITIFFDDATAALVAVGPHGVA